MFRTRKRQDQDCMRISTGVFLSRQSELFLAFRTNHSFSRIVDKKTRPNFNALFLAVSLIGPCQKLKKTRIGLFFVQ